MYIATIQGSNYAVHIYDTVATSIPINPFTGEFMVTVSDINGLFFLFFFSIKFIVKQVFE